MTSADIVHEQVNRIRLEHGLPVLSRSELLEIAAQTHADDMARFGYHSHTGRDGKSVTERVRRTGYFENATQWFVAENIAVGYTTPVSVVNGWLDSEGHRRNMLHERATDIGVGTQADEDGMLFWVQVFGSRVIQ